MNASGHSRHIVEKLVSDGRLVRIRRGWVAASSADRELVAVARAGGVVTCVSAARRLGLWVLSEHTTHVGAPAHAGRFPFPDGHVHWRKPPLPRHPDSLVDPIENVLIIAATCQPYEEALVIWEAALRKGMVTVEGMRRLTLPPAARVLLRDALPWADSGLESLVPPRLRWLRLPIRAQTWIAGHRVDFLIGDRLVLQVDGGTHVGAQREMDVAHDAALALMGYHVIRVGYRQVIEGWHEVQDLIMRAVAQGLHRAV